MVVVASIALAEASCSGLSVDAELACDNRIVTSSTLANTIDALFNEFLGTYRFELQCTVVKARRHGCPWFGRWEEEPCPPSCGGGLVSFLDGLTLGVGPNGGVKPSCNPFAGGVDPPALFAHSSSFED
jgi:hypothetical protein